VVVLVVLVKIPSGGERLFQGKFEPDNPMAARSACELGCPPSENARKKRTAKNPRKTTHRAIRPPMGTTYALQRE
jgi:hypothetical protein